MLYELYVLMAHKPARHERPIGVPTVTVIFLSPYLDFFFSLREKQVWTRGAHVPSRPHGNPSCSPLFLPFVKIPTYYRCRLIERYVG